MLWNVNSGYLQAVKFYDNLEFMNYTIMYVPHVLHIPSWIQTTGVERHKLAS